MAWTQTTSGKAFSLTKPNADDVNFDKDVAPQLSRLARFVGATSGDCAYSVAQHSVLGAESLYVATGSARLAALFTLHDGHEYVIGDWTSPAVEALAERLGGIVIEAIEDLKHSIDEAIHKAAGIAMPTISEVQILRAHDLAMLAAERNALMSPCPSRWRIDAIGVKPANVDPLDLRPWDESVAADEFRDALEKFLRPARDEVR